MMDQRERAAYTSINYKIHKTCAICTHSTYKKGYDTGNWGICKLRTTNTGSASGTLLIHKSGGCCDWVQSLDIVLNEFSHTLDIKPREQRASEIIAKGLLKNT